MLILNRALNTDNGIISVITSGNYYGTEEYIPFSQYANKQISISTRMSVAFYDSTKQFISSFRSNITSSGKVPNNTAFMRCDVHKDYYNEAQIEQNSTATSYEAYVEPQIYIKNSNDVYEEFIKKEQEIYSTSETKIGTWIDGKPLYRKVLKINNIRIDTSTIIITNILNMDTLINAEGLFINGSNGIYSPYPIYSGTNFLQMYISQDGTKIGFIGNDSWSANINRTHLFILEYTKTTD